ncbi:MAG: hydroxymethylbilane synthase [Haloferacaceae archaeon]
MNEGTVRLATRGSTLARRQAATVREALSSRRIDVELVEVETRGDRITDELIHRLGRTGAFVRALDERVLSGDADAAVHSMKDMPTEFPAELVVAGVPERAPAGDVLVTPGGTSLAELPHGATVGTSSLRRGAQLSNARPDLEVEPLRGNVDTRLEKLLAPSLQREHQRRLDAESDEAFDEDVSFDRTAEEWFDDLSELERAALGRELDREYDAIVLAEAGLRRSGLFRSLETERLDRSQFVPSPGQGAIAVTASDPEVIEAIRSRIDHPPTRVATTVERTVLEELGGGCIAPIGVNALVQGEYVHTRAQVSDVDGETVINRTRDLPVESHAQAAAAFADDLADRGAAELIEEARDRAEGA